MLLASCHVTRPFKRTSGSATLLVRGFVALSCGPDRGVCGLGAA